MPAYHFECTGVFTTWTPTDAYCGAGRPEATSPSSGPSRPWLGRWASTRRRSGGATTSGRTRPYLSSGTLTYDSGDYEPTLDRAFELIDHDGLQAEQRRRDAGETKHLGIGLSTYVEMCGLAPSRVLAAQVRRRWLGGGHRASPPERSRW